MAQQQPFMNAADVERAARLRQIQMEALGTSRRDFLTTHDVPDQFVAHLSTPNVEHHRRVNQTGTRENKVTDQHRDRLAGWNSAWENLQNDDALEQGLEDINAGQSHRARLLTVLPRIQEGSSREDEIQHRGRGGSHPRGTGRGGRGGRGGSIIGTQPARTARRRVPIDGTKGHPARGVVASKLALPSTSKPQNVPTLQLRLPAVSLSRGSSDTSSNNRLRIHPGNFTLAPPGQFMSHVSIWANTTTPAASVTKAHQVESPFQSKQPEGVSTGVGSASKRSEVRSRAVPAPTSATEPQASKKVPPPPPPPQGPSQASAGTLDGDATRSNEEDISSPTRSYAVDLLGTDIDESNSLPIPMQLSAARHTERRQSSPPFTSPSLEHFSSQIESFLPILRELYPAETVETLESVKVDLLRRIQESTRGGAQQQSSVLASKPPREDGQKESLPIRGRAIAVEQGQEPSKGRTQELPSLAQEARAKATLPSLASAVEQRTSAWGKGVIAGAESGSSSFLGENISRWRFSRRRLSLDSLASVVSAGSSTALTERIDQLRIDESRPPISSPVTGSKETYATTNPFGPKPTLQGATSRSPTSSNPPGIPTGRGTGTHIAGPQLPLFLRSQVRADDPAAAIRAEFAASFPGRLSSNEPAANPTAGGTVVSRGASLVLSRQQGYPQEVGATGNRVEENPAHRSNSRTTQNSSISSLRVPRTVLGEDRAPSQPRGSVRAGPRPAGLTGTGRNSLSTSGDLPRFHPRLGNQTTSPSVRPTPSQSYFSGPRMPSRAPAGPALPSFLVNIQPAADPGAAAAEQYSRASGCTPEKKSSRH
ncbi:MAG: hypothetical protein LQ339_004372 [Xanthoria mediterranea]|nr:MAG: hypothetical protein LQ339_004372 [Xanthoria mediterranea]